MTIRRKSPLVRCKKTPKWLLKRDPLEELLKRVKKQSSGCWEWNRYKDVNGYGQINWWGELWVSHRWAYFITHGDFPRKLFVLHKCDNPGCCNPDHLFLGTQRDNIQDALSKGRFNLPSLKRNEGQKHRWSDPVKRQEQAERIQRSWSDPVRRREQIAKIKLAWSDPVKRANMLVGRIK